MAVSGSGNNQDPLQAYRLVARDAQKSGEFDNVVQGQERSGAIKTGKMSWKEWFISWLPAALVSGGPSKEVSAAFQSALEARLGQEGRELSGESKKYLASGKPLTARKVINILVAEGFTKEGDQVKQNIKNWDAFVSHFNEGKEDRDQIKEGSPLYDNFRLSITANAESYEKDLGNDYFAEIELNYLEDIVNNKRAPKASLEMSQRGLACLKGKLGENSSLARRLDKALAIVNAKLELLEWEDGNQVVKHSRVPFSDSIKESILEKFNTDAFSDYSDQPHFSTFGEGADLRLERQEDGGQPEGANMVMLASGFAKDIGRCDATLNDKPFLTFDAETKMTDQAIAEKMEVLREAFVGEGSPYSAEEGEAYLQQLTNFLGQTIAASVLTSLDAEFKVSGSGDFYISYSINVNEDGTVDVKVSYEKAIKALVKDGVVYDSDPSLSRERFELDFVFNPKAAEGDPKFALGDECFYEQYAVNSNSESVVSGLSFEAFSDSIQKEIEADAFINEDGVTKAVTHPQSGYFDASGQQVDEGGLVRMGGGLGNDIGRCTISIDGVDPLVEAGVPPGGNLESSIRDRQREVFIGRLLGDFEAKYPGKGEEYLKAFANVMGQRLWEPLMLNAANIVGGTVLDGEGPAGLSYDVSFVEEDGRVKVKVTGHTDKALAYFVSSESDELNMALDPSQSRAIMDVELMFDPEAPEGDSKILLGEGTQYSHVLVPKKEED